MSRPGAAQPEQAGPLDPVAYRHHQLLLRAMHYAHEVMHEGLYQYIHTMTPRQAGGRIQMDVYFTGRPEPVDSATITLAEPAKETACAK